MVCCCWSVSLFRFEKLALLIFYILNDTCFFSCFRNLKDDNQSAIIGDVFQKHWDDELKKEK